MREFIRRNPRKRLPGEPDFVKGFVGFLTYEGESHFVYADEVMSGSAAAAAGYFLKTVVRKRSEQHAASVPGKPPQPQRLAMAKSHFTYPQYKEKLQRIKECLYAGETYQVNFSQKFEAPYAGGAFELYQKLAAINPSPFQFFMEASAEASKFAVISNSPERLFCLRKQDSLTPPTVGSRGFPSGELMGETVGFPQIIETRPIKGTMPRGKTPEEDFANTQKLLASEKDRAELAMIVDLERNDIGKLCVPGTVEVTEERTIEKYSHVIHTVANIRGVLEDQYDWHDALKALFPGGSVTGCPKKRTMEIIRELEGEPRGAYCGSAGWIDLSGDCDFNILIRTLWLENGIITFRSGGGIVVDSDPQKEYEETLYKAAVIAQAISEC